MKRRAARDDHDLLDGLQLTFVNPEFVEPDAVGVQAARSVS